MIRGHSPDIHHRGIINLAPLRSAIGMMEQWNHGFWNIGMMGLENQNENNCIDFLVIVAYFLGQKQKWMSDRHHHKM